MNDFFLQHPGTFIFVILLGVSLLGLVIDNAFTYFVEPIGYPFTHTLVMASVALLGLEVAQLPLTHSPVPLPAPVYVVLGFGLPTLYISMVIREDFDRFDRRRFYNNPPT